MDRYECKTCNYIYVPETGDSNSGITADTPFDSLPSGWVCPVCGADQGEFKKEK